LSITPSLLPAKNQHPIRVIGPRELEEARRAGENIVSTVSAAEQDWQRELSPFHLGPVELYDGHRARCMENGWQFAKVYACHADEEGKPLPAYWEWAQAGWAKPAQRYPMGKGAKPMYSLWDGEHLGYLEARARVYWPLYRDAVRNTAGFARLQELHAKGPLSLFDFDGYDAQARCLSIKDVSLYVPRPMGHAFVLKAMLMYGPDVAPSDLLSTFAEEQACFIGGRPPVEQFSLL